MNNKTIQNLLFIIVSVFSLNTFAAGWNATTHDLVAGDFNADGKDDMLYVAKDPSSKSGIVLADENGELSILHQEWDSNHLGLNWHSGTYTPHVGDFNGDGRADVFMDHNTNGSNYVLLANASGQLDSKDQTIGNTAIGLNWGDSRLVFGDFNGDTRTDVYLQPKDAQTSSRIVFATTAGTFTTIGDTWGNEHLGFQWSQNDAMVYAGDFDGNYQDDLLIQAKPDWVMIPYSDLVIPVQRFEDQANGIVMANASGLFSAGASLDFWSSEFLNINWSPHKYQVVVGDYNSDGKGDIFLQSLQPGQQSFVLLTSADGQLSNLAQVAVTLDASYSATSSNPIAADLNGDGASQLYLQAQGVSGDNYVATANSNASVFTTTVHDTSEISPVAPTPPGLSPAGDALEAHGEDYYGWTAGDLQIDAQGNANYRVGIDTPPGRGVTPSLSINYHSGRGNGLLGQGFVLSGLSTIARCETTIVTDGFIDPVDYDDNDAFCLNGERLIETSPGSKEYRTRIDTFSRVKAYGNDANDPDYFIEESKDGMIKEYGRTADSRIEAQGKTEARIWGVNQVSDTSDNHYTVHYFEDNANGDYRVSEMRYVYVGSAHHNKVIFDYEARPDTVLRYGSGSKIQRNKRLSAVKTYVDDVLVKEYQLAYDQDNATGRSQLESLTECTGSTCRKPKAFVWSESSSVPSFSISANTDSYGGVNNDADNQHLRAIYGRGKWHQINFNNDGRFDLYREAVTGYVNPTLPDTLVVNSPVTVTLDKVTVYPSLKLTGQTDGWTIEENIELGFSPRLKLTGDLNGDGFTDRFSVGPDRRIVPAIDTYLSNGQGGFTHSLWGPVSDLLPKRSNDEGPDDEYHNVLSGDIDGDGLVDVIRRSNLGNNRIYFSNGDGTFTESEVSDTNTLISQPGDDKEWWTGDFNGDGRADLFNCDQLYLSDYSPAIDGSNNRVGNWDIVNHGLGPSCNRVHLMDVNGDGLEDLMKVTFTSVPRAGGGYDRTYHWTAYLSDGIGGFVEQPSNSPDAFDLSNNGYNTDFIRDFNGDGYVDFLSVKKAGSNTDYDDAYYFYLGNGQGGWSVATTIPIVDNDFDKNVWFVGDADADGDVDIVRRSDSVPVSYVIPNENGNNNHIITNEHVQSRLVGVRDEKHTDLTITYKSLWDNSVYSQGDCQPTLDNGAIVEQCVKGSSRYVVSDVHKSDGKTGGAGLRHTTYTYEGLKRHLNGYGSLGFAKKVRTDHDIGTQGANLISTSWSRQDYPYMGMAYRTQIELSSGQVLERTDYDYLTHGNFQNDGYAFPYISNQDKYVCDLSANCTDSTIVTGFTSLTTTTNHCDDYGQMTQIDNRVQDASGTYLSQTKNSYDNARFITSSNWLLNRAVHTEIRGGTGNGVLSSAVRITTANYDATTGLMTQSVIEPNGNNTQRLQANYIHDTYGNITQTSIVGSGQTRTVATSYDSRGQFAVSETNALGQTSTSQYERHYGQVTQVTDVNGLTATTVYDGWGRPTLTTLPNGTQTAVDYKYVMGVTESVPGAHADALTYEQSKTTGQTAVRIFSDRFGREVRSRVKGFDGSYIHSDKRYDYQGRTVGVSQAYYPGASVYWTISTYDLLNRTVAITSPIDGATTTSYNGLETTVTNAKGQTRVNYNNSLGQTLWIKDAANNVNTFEYDVFSNLQKVTNPNNDSIINSYDVLGRKTQMNDPDSGVWTYAYNAFGEMLTQTDAKNQTQTLAYNALGQLVQRTDNDGVSEWVYGTSASSKNVGQLVEEKLTENGSIVWRKNYNYDSLARPSNSVTQMDGQSYTTGQNYDTVGRLQTLTYPVSPSYPNGFEITHQYNDRGYLERLNDVDGHVYFQNVNVNALGQSTNYYLGDGSSTLRSFETGTARLNSTQTARATTTLQQYSYQYDVLGTLTQRQDDKRNLSESFTFDELNRVRTSSVVGQVSKTYDYDALGNMTYKTGVGNYTYGNCGAGPHAVCKAGSKTYQYDANGSRISGSDGSAMLWTATANKPKQMSKGSYQSSFKYDANQARYKHTKTDATGTSTLYYVGGLYEKVVKASGTEHQHYISVGGETIALKIDKGSSQVDTHYIHKDHLGSYGTITDQNMQILESSSYDVFGERRNAETWADDSSARSNETRGYTGHEHLDDLGLIHMNGRVYDPVIGRFTSADPFIPDPSDLQSFNRYSYVRNNPLNRVDPTGFEDTDSDAEVENSTAPEETTHIVVVRFNDGTTVEVAISAGHDVSQSAIEQAAAEFSVSAVNENATASKDSQDFESNSKGISQVSDDKASAQFDEVKRLTGELGYDTKNIKYDSRYAVRYKSDKTYGYFNTYLEARHAVNSRRRGQHVLGYFTKNENKEITLFRGAFATDISYVDANPYNARDFTKVDFKQGIDSAMFVMGHELGHKFAYKGESELRANEYGLEFMEKYQEYKNFSYMSY